MLRTVLSLVLSILLSLYLLGCSLFGLGSSNGGSGSSSGPSSLVISEVGSCPYTNISSWFEVYNYGSKTVDLEDIQLHAPVRSRDDPYKSQGNAVISLPSLKIPPGGYALVRGRNSDNYVTGERVAYVKTESNNVPNWVGTGGFIELLSSGDTVDFVRFGASVQTPSSGGEWDYNSAPSLPYGSQNYGYALARNADNKDTDSSSDWFLRDFSTPGGPNDVTTTTDSDGDGIPDANESPDSTFAGMPLYEWGARPDTRDIFIHVDYMQSLDAGITPRQNAMDAVVDAFASENIHIHIDVGDLFHKSAGIDPSMHDLSDESHEVPYHKAIEFGEYSGYANIYEYKYNYMPLERKQIFHYAIFANSQNADGSGGSTGRAELNGNDLMITLGNNGLNLSTPKDINLVENWQAGTLMHELGHNLGLEHGGNESENYKPNYFSIMNYLYSLTFLPDIGTEDDEGDRYYLEYTLKSYQYIDDLHRNPYDNPPSQVNMDYSHGAGNSIDESDCSENEGLGQPGDAYVDYNGNGTVPDDLGSYNLNKRAGTEKNVIEDYDDWANLDLFFARSYQGDTHGVPISRSSETDTDTFEIMGDPTWNDRQEVYPEPPHPLLHDWRENR